MASTPSPPPVTDADRERYDTLLGAGGVAVLLADMFVLVGAIFPSGGMANAPPAMQAAGLLVFVTTAFLSWYGMGLVFEGVGMTLTPPPLPFEGGDGRDRGGDAE